MRRPPIPCRFDLQALRIVEDILYAPSEEEGERVLGQAMGELEARGAGVPAAAAAGVGGQGAEAEAAPALQGLAPELGCAA